ncbi:MAG: SOS response-associated peptidase [Nitrospiraceae bacterium]|nr:MAG: SOS response-associated peptidase [Nitrospiraceae bacterium]
MCGRFVRYSALHDLAREFQTEEPVFDLPPSYNIAPSQTVVIAAGNARTHLDPCTWGYLPSWAKTPATGYRMINARAESVADKPSFKQAFSSERILVIANGFYEWRQEGRIKTPFYIYLTSKKPFGFAGLRSIWTDPGGAKRCTCTIITTRPNSLLAPIHDRMPAIIAKQDEQAWLNPDNRDRDALLSLLQPYDSSAMKCHEVSALVNSPTHDSPECLNPA